MADLNNDGAEDRKKRGGKYYVYTYLLRLIKERKPFPSTYGIECFNCNLGSYNNERVCPHNKPIIISEISRFRKLHKKVIIKYGGMCVGCGETELGFLTLEHIEGGGRKEIREKFRGLATYFYMNLRDIPIRDDITVLCYNCNYLQSIIRD